MIEGIDWDKNPLIPAIAQDFKTSEVLMLAYMNKESLELTLKSGVVHYFSRSKQRIWKKGEESGNIQNVKELFLDCDSDTILIKVEQVGDSACHTGKRSCFFKKIENSEIKEIGEKIFDPSLRYSVIDRLYHEIESKKDGDVEKSYTALLFQKGENSIIKKVIEESGELCFAIKDGNEEEIIHEGADLLYHVLVALKYREVSPERIKQELEKRFGVSGIEEKRNRQK